MPRYSLDRYSPDLICVSFDQQGERIGRFRLPYLCCRNDNINYFAYTNTLGIFHRCAK